MHDIPLHSPHNFKMHAEHDQMDGEDMVSSPAHNGGPHDIDGFSHSSHHHHHFDEHEPHSEEEDIEALHSEEPFVDHSHNLGPLEHSEDLHHEGNELVENYNVNGGHHINNLGDGRDDLGHHHMHNPEDGRDELHRYNGHELDHESDHDIPLIPVPKNHEMTPDEYGKHLDNVMQHFMHIVQPVWADSHNKNDHGGQRHEGQKDGHNAHGFNLDIGNPDLPTHQREYEGKLILR